MDSGKPSFQLPHAEEQESAAPSTTLPLGQATRRKLADTVTDQLSKAIRPLQPGTRLPSTQQLTRMLGVGRSTVREALNGLAVLGMVEIRHGHGVVVAAGVAIDQGQDAMSVALAKGVTRNLLEARQIVEVANARLAARRRTDLDLQEIETVLENHERSLDYPAKSGMEFHGLIAKAAHNDVLAGVFRSCIKPIFARGPQLYEQLAGFARWELEQHRWIYEAIRAQNAEEAAERMHQHVTAMESHYRKVGVA